MMAKAAKGDELAFEILVHRHQTSVLNLIYRYVGDRTQAKDFAQEVFLRVWKASGNYKPTAKFTTWIYRITVNLCLNELKSSGKKMSHLLESYIEERRTMNGVGEVSPSGEDLLLAEERNRQVSEALQTLPENQRMALILKRYDNLSYQEIANIMGCSVSAVESLLVRAKRNIQEKLTLFRK